MNSVGLTDTETIHKGLTYCKNQDYDIINMSFGRQSFDDTIEEDLKELKEKDVILNSSVGDNKEEFTYPASSSYTYAVQTQDEDGKRDVNTNTSSSKQGILCPGENISVLRMNEEGEKVFQKDTASSYACAIFTGYVSLLMVRQKDFSLTWLDTQLKSDTLYNKDSFLGILKQKAERQFRFRFLPRLLPLLFLGFFDKEYLQWQRQLSRGHSGFHVPRNEERDNPSRPVPDLLSGLFPDW